MSEEELAVDNFEVEINEILLLSNELSNSIDSTDEIKEKFRNKQSYFLGFFISRLKSIIRFIDHPVVIEENGHKKSFHDEKGIFVKALIEDEITINKINYKGWSIFLMRGGKFYFFSRSGHSFLGDRKSYFKLIRGREIEIYELLKYVDFFDIINSIHCNMYRAIKRNPRKKTNLGKKIEFIEKIMVKLNK
jgi:hypothetical protein